METTMGPSLVQYGTDEVIGSANVSQLCGVSLQTQLCIQCHFMKETKV